MFGREEGVSLGGGVGRGASAAASRAHDWRRGPTLCLNASYVPYSAPVWSFVVMIGMWMGMGIGVCGLSAENGRARERERVHHTTLPLTDARAERRSDAKAPRHALSAVAAPCHLGREVVPCECGKTRGCGVNGGRRQG